MKKRSLLLSLLLTLCFLFALTASAHPGDTDSSGGHHNGSDYHYHHGYPAHEHYDLDGDGVLDCPYDFHDNTDHDSSNSGGSASSSSAHQSSESFSIQNIYNSTDLSFSGFIGSLFPIGATLLVTAHLVFLIYSIAYHLITSILSWIIGMISDEKTTVPKSVNAMIHIVLTATAYILLLPLVTKLASGTTDRIAATIFIASIVIVILSICLNNSSMELDEKDRTIRDLEAQLERSSSPNQNKGGPI